jgi:3-carboxy-cis,cis-muconate cycloisomerase
MTFAPLFVPEEIREAVSDRAWLAAMLDFERALAAAEAAEGVIPTAAGGAIAEACAPDGYDVDALAEQGRAVGNPAEPLVRALRERVGGEAAGFVHWGATSQDVTDTAAMLVAQRALERVLAELAAVADGLAALAEEHRSTPMVGRTLLQHAAPTTFGVVAAGWLVAAHEARARLADVASERLAVQLGGAVGTLSVLGSDGERVLARVAEELALAEPVLPWHANRTRIAELGAALAECAGVLDRIALDLALLAQTDVGEVREAAGGGSSTLPHKQNPVGSVLVRASARLVAAYSGVLTGGLAQEHERGAAGWQAEWEALSGALAHTGGAAHTLAVTLAGLEVDVDRMRRNLDATGGLVLSEGVAFALAPTLGRERAHELVREVALTAGRSGRTFREELVADGRVELTDVDLEDLLDPARHLGPAEALVDRALAFHRSGAA